MQITEIKQYIIAVLGLVGTIDKKNLLELIVGAKDAYKKRAIWELKKEKYLSENSEHIIKLKFPNGVDELSTISHDLLLHYLFLTNNHNMNDRVYEQGKICTYLLLNNFKINLMHFEYVPGRNKKAVHDNDNLMHQKSIFHNNIPKPYSAILDMCDIEDKIFLPSVFIKGLNRSTIAEKRKSRIKQSRSFGILISSRNIYPCYVINEGRMKWLDIIERDMLTHINMTAREVFGANLYNEIRKNENEKDAIFFYESKNDLSKIVEYREKYQNTFNNIYLVNIKEKDSLTFQIVTSLNWKRKLANNIFQNTVKKKAPYHADTILEDGTLVYELLTNNLIKINYIIRALERNKKVVAIVTPDDKKRLYTYFGNQLPKLDLVFTPVEDLTALQATLKLG